MRRYVPSLDEVRRITQKKRDAWWTVLLVDPIATPLVRFTAARTRITPNQITWAALFLGLASAACFAMGDWGWLLIGALVYHLSFVLDCMDGKIARLTGTGSVFGAWLDYVFDRIRVMACALALMAGQYERTGDTLYIWLAAAVIFLDGLRYINSLEIFKTRHSMRKQLKSRMRAARRADNQDGLTFMEDLLRANPEAEVEQDVQRVGQEGAPAESGQPQHQVVDLHREFRSRFHRYLRVRSFLLRHRIRTHVMSGIEFQMGVFIIGPLLDAVLATTIISAILLLIFELAIIYKFLLSTRDFARTLESFDRHTPDPVAPETPLPYEGEGEGGGESPGAGPDAGPGPGPGAAASPVVDTSLSETGAPVGRLS